MDQTRLTRWTLKLIFSAAFICIIGASAWATNTCIIVSDTVPRDQGRCSLYVKIANDVPVKNMVIPLTIREVTAGCFPDSVELRRNERLVSNLTQISVIDLKNDVVGTCKAGQPGGYTGVAKYSFSGKPDTLVRGTGPDDGFLISIGKLFPSDASMAAGSDVTGSMLIIIGSPHTEGTFEIDTTCVNVQNHLVYVNDAGTGIVPDFTKGVIHVGNPSAVQYLGGDGIPRDYSLDQNYPNPFNASTVIRFNTKHDGNVRLEVFNILGQKVATLVNEFRHYGPQAADWNGTDFNGVSVPTGLYFYRLTTADFTDVKKMVLLK